MTNEVAGGNLDELSPRGAAAEAAKGNQGRAGRTEKRFQDGKKLVDKQRKTWYSRNPLKGGPPSGSRQGLRPCEL